MQEAADLADLFAALASIVVRTIRADACLVSLVDEHGALLRDIGASVVPPARLNSLASEYLVGAYPQTRWVLETQGTVTIVVGDPHADPAEKRMLRETGFSTVLICPLILNGQAIGTVKAFRLEERPFRADDPDQIGGLCAFAANSYSRIQLAEKLENQYTVTLEALASALEAKDPYTEAHTGRIRDMSTALGVALQVPSEVRRAVRLGAILHDVGKIGIADAVLLKPGPLTAEEWQVMRTHPEIGERMLKKIDFVRPALPVIRHHHERWDGRGYPDGLAGEDIPVGARIVAVCDSFDAMTSDRPYRAGMPIEAASDEILRCAGTQFDPSCAALLVDILSKVGDDRLEERFVRYAS